MENTFSAATYMRKGHNSGELRSELQKYELSELKKIYKSVSGFKLSTKVSKNKELLIESIIEATLRMCNHGWVFHPNTCHSSGQPYK